MWTSPDASGSRPTAEFSFIPMASARKIAPSNGSASTRPARSFVDLFRNF